MPQEGGHQNLNTKKFTTTTRVDLQRELTGDTPLGLASLQKRLLTVRKHRAKAQEKEVYAGVASEEASGQECSLSGPSTLVSGGQMWMIHKFSFPPYKHHCLQGETFNLAMASGRMMLWRPLDINVDSHNTASFRWRSPFNRSEAQRNFPSKIFRSISSEKEYF